MANTEKRKRRKATYSGPPLIFDGHGHRFSGLDFQKDRRATLVVFTIKDAETGHQQKLAIPWEICRRFTVSFDITGEVVRLNGHKHRVLGHERKKKQGTTWHQIGLQDCSVEDGYVHSLEISQELLSLLEVAGGSLETLERIMQVTGSIPDRFARAVAAFLEDPKDGGDRDG